MSAEADPSTLRLFAGLVEHGSFGRAATALGVSRPRLSRTMTELEAELGFALFDRSTEGLQLTDEGRRLLADAPAIIAADDERMRLLAEQAALPVALRIAFVPGVTITKWTRSWAERHPETPLEVTPATDEAAQDEVLRSEVADVSFVRFPVDGAGLNVVPLYREVAVVVVPKEHPISLFESLPEAELAGEKILPAIPTVPDALELVAAGVGLVVVPQSIARLHARKDLVYRPLSDVAETQIAVAWRADDASPLVEEFIGIVRGRTAQSSRAQNAATAKAAAEPARARDSRPKPSGARSARPAAKSGVKKGKRRGSR
jgi:DNA-binding transcriptional LysR family regulator